MPKDKFAITAYDTTANTVTSRGLAPGHEEIFTIERAKEVLREFIENKKFNFLHLEKNGRVIATYMLNRKKDKWTRLNIPATSSAR